MAAKTLMIQGTASSVGKSLLAAALCRLLRQDGLRVAPFKSQNMALNSFVTREGGEMGRAQVVQALAAGVEPSVDMNPILLKPEADHRSQVVVLGRARASMGFRDYRSLRHELLGVVEGALQRLRAAYDVVVIEGAGSPAEINLREGEIVNMRIARMAGAPVLLAGDIDRGGVFAHLVGTLALLEPDERALVRGFLINKFRGDASLLQPGIDFLERRTGVPVVGVIPYLADVRLPEEDSVALEGPHPLAPSPPTWKGGAPAAIVDVVVVHLPHVANFDDFDPLAGEPGVAVRYVRAPEEVGEPDLIVVPGTKSTVADLRWLRERGLAEAIVARVRRGTPAIGICGGYQMLGHAIEDPLGVESAPGDCVDGLGLLPVRTVFAPEKATHQVRARVLEARGLLTGCAGHAIRGYEIHMGRTAALDNPGGTLGPAFALESPAGAPATDLSAGSEGSELTLSAAKGQAGQAQRPTTDGMLNQDGRVLGTYLHGLFDNAGLRRALLHNLAQAKGLAGAPETAAWGRLASLDEQLDRLAAAVRASVDVGRIYEMAGLRLRDDRLGPAQRAATTGDRSYATDRTG